jgi:uncharacterized protein
MKVDISDILITNGASKEVKLKEAPEERKITDGCFLDGDLSFVGTLTNENDVFLMEGTLEISYISECYRCLKPLKNNMKLKISESFVHGDSPEQSDMYVFEGKTIDLSKVIYDNIILNLPMKQLCSENCRGLCSICGANLNEKQCGCDSEKIDTRLEGLKKFFES